MIADFMQEREVETPCVLFACSSHSMNIIIYCLQLLVYVDLHGHSRKHNVFMYGCHTPQCDHTQFLNERVLPFLLSQEASGQLHIVDNALDHVLGEGPPM